MSQSIPTACVVFGATGDLMAKKIVPALFQLHEQKRLPAGFRLVGFARRDLGDTGFRDSVRAILAAHAPDAPAADVEHFVSLATYVRGEFPQPEGYQKLLAEIAGQNAVLYLSVPPESFGPIFEHLTAFQFGARGDVWTRLVVEKPIGRDGASGRALDQLIAKGFAESQVYRVDHYLAKDIVPKILDFRFKDGSLESKWNKDHIAHIHVRLLETLGVEKRGAFYDRLGTLRDVGQNHLLEMLAYVTMERPASWDAAHIRPRRVELLCGLLPPAPADTFRAQYDGYRAIPGVDLASETETYYRVRTFLSQDRWRGVPITMESGKRMPANLKDVTVTFKDGTEKTFDFAWRASGSRAQYVEEYEKLLEDCLKGDQTRFLSAEEIDVLWAWTDPIVRAWEQDASPLAFYLPGTTPL